MQRFYSAINYEKEIYPVKITIKKIKQGGKRHKFFSYAQRQTPQSKIRGETLF